MTADARAALFVAAASLGLGGCHGAENARGLDRICDTRLNEGLACQVVGVGRQGSGPTDDSTGFSLDDATLVIHLEAAADLRAPGPFDISLLTIAREPGTPLDFALTWGSCAKGCPGAPPPTVTALPSEHAWVTVASGVRGSAADATIQYDAVMSFTGVEIEIADLRITATP